MLVRVRTGSVDAMGEHHGQGVLRHYADGDLDEVLDVWYRASLVAHAFLPADFLHEERQRLRELWLPSSETTVWERGGCVVGFLSLVGNEVGGLFVDPDHHRTGVGRALMDAARWTRPHLELGVFEANALGRSFYAAYGFIEVERRTEAQTGLPELRLRLA